MTQKGITAAELMAKLMADPEFVAKRARAEDDRVKREAEYRLAEGPLINELRAAGYAVESAWDLVNTAASYPNAIPILIAHLTRPYPVPVREGIARALAVGEARHAWGVLTRLYQDEHEARVKDGLACALAAAANEELIGEVVALARDASQGPSRVLLLSALERSADSRARAALMELSTDPDLASQIQVIEQRRRRTRAHNKVAKRPPRPPRPR